MGKIIHLNEDSFDEKVLQRGKKILVNFWAEWCGPCKFVNGILEELAEEEDCDLCLVNVDVNPVLMERFHIETIPNVLFYQEGKLTEQFKKLDVLIKKEEMRKRILPELIEPSKFEL